MRSRLIAVSIIAAAAALLPMAGASASPARTLPTHTMTITRQGVTAHVTIKGDWKLSDIKLAPTHLPKISTQKAPVRNSVGSLTSNNWSGYGDEAHGGVSLRYVQASFNAASVDCALTTLGTQGIAEDSAWTGLDGLNGTTVEQTGFSGACEAGNVSDYFAWYEMFPLDPVTFTGINPGDALESEVFYNATTHLYSLSLIDSTQGGAGIFVTVACPAGSTCRNNSAEVITEDPGDSAPAVDLADFGQQNYTSAVVTSRNGTRGTLASGSLWNGFAITSVAPNHDVLASPGALQGNTAFVESFRHSQ